MGVVDRPHQTLVACSWTRGSYVAFFAVVDDSFDHVGPLCLGPAEQRPDRIILVWNTI